MEHDDESIERLVEDSFYGVLGNPAWPEHDERGFRNDLSFPQPNLLIGDSQVYSIAVDRDQSWPVILQNKYPVYSVAVGGWGVFQYFIASMEFFRAEVNNAFIFLYTGNDFAEVIPAGVKSKSQYKNLFWESRWNDINVRRRVGFYSRRNIINKLKIEKGFDEYDACTYAAEQKLVDCGQVRLGRNTYLLKPSFRKQLMDFSDESIRAGFSFFERAVPMIAERADKFGINLMFGIIPT